ncbi:MAG: hypothetical protein AAGF89_03275 [Bacteroidota bacterium]
MMLPTKVARGLAKESVSPSFDKPGEIPFSKYLSHYWNERKYLARRVYLRGDTLFYGKDRASGYPIYPLQANIFQADNGLRFTFTADAQGNYQLRIHQFGKLLSTLSPYVPVSQDEVTVTEYVGAYWSNELLAEYQFLRQGTQLIWYSEGEAVASLIPIFKDTFQTPGGTTFSFLRDEEGNTMNCTMSNRRLSGLVFTRKE